MSRTLTTIFSVALFVFTLFLVGPESTKAAPLLEYRDTLSDSGPNEQSNHTVHFVLPVDVSPSG